MVLDLSNCKLIELPGEIGYLVNLQYLNFSHTEINFQKLNKSRACSPDSGL